MAVASEMLHPMNSLAWSCAILSLCWPTTVACCRRTKLSIAPTLLVRLTFDLFAVELGLSHICLKAPSLDAAAPALIALFCSLRLRLSFLLSARLPLRAATSRSYSARRSVLSHWAGGSGS